MKMLLESHDYVSLLFRNISFYLRLTLAVLRRPHTLLPRLVRSERNFSAYPKPTVYFIANALLAILLPLLSRLPKDGGAKDSILFSLSNINSQSALIFIAFCGYLLGIVLFSLLLKGQVTQACNQFPRWVYGGGKVLPGLVTRRAAEKQLCLDGVE